MNCPACGRFMKRQTKGLWSCRCKQMLCNINGSTPLSSVQTFFNSIDLKDETDEQTKPHRRTSQASA